MNFPKLIIIINSGLRRRDRNPGITGATAADALPTGAAAADAVPRRLRRRHAPRRSKGCWCTYAAREIEPREYVVIVLYHCNQNNMISITVYLYHCLSLSLFISMIVCVIIAMMGGG